jgi:hypothetical protein
MSAQTFYHEMCGAIHLHTTFSDGGTDCPCLIAAAQAVGLDYIILTDHMSLGARQAGFEGFHKELFVIVGYEHNDSENRNHYLAIGTESVVAGMEDPQVYIDTVRNAGGIGFLAHPSEDRHYFNRYPPYPWTAWHASGYDGIELWNQMSEWVENLKKWYSFIRVLYPRRFLKGVPPDLIRRWDALNAAGFVSGIGGVDAHTYPFPLGIFTLRVFPIKVELKGIRTHLYLEERLPVEDASRAKKMVMSALRDGNGFISNFRRGDARGTRMHAWSLDGKCHLPGRNPHVTPVPLELEVTLPEKAEIRLIRNGVQSGSIRGSHCRFAITEKGSYRVEVRRKNQAWIYSNPFPVART